MNDMRLVIIPKSDQLNADSLLGGPLTITVAEVTIRPGTEQPVTVHYHGEDGKPWKPCKSMARVMVRCWGPDANQYAGKRLTLWCDPKVKWGGMAVGGIRISHISDIAEPITMALTETKGSKKLFTVHPLKIAAKPDKAAQVADELVARFNGADRARLDEIAADEAAKKQRAWLAEKRPELAAKVDAAAAAALAALDADAGPAFDGDAGHAGEAVG